MKYLLNEIKENEQNLVQLLRVGSFNHPAYGKFEITKDVLKKLSDNFKSNVRQVDLSVDYFHKPEQEAAGWIKDVLLLNEDQELWIDVDWTETGKEKIEDKEFRYISADFSMNYKDAESGKEYGPTLFGAGLTNRPFVKNMRAILSEATGLDDDDVTVMLDAYERKNTKLNQGAEKMEFEQILEALSSLTPDQAAQALDKLRGMVKAEMPEMSENEKALMDKNKELSEKLTLAERKGDFQKLLSEGKVVPAQEEAFINGDMAKFAELSEGINLSHAGTERTPQNKDADTNKQEEAVKKLSEIHTEIMAKEGVDAFTAMRLAEQRNPELVQKLNEME